MKIAWNNPKKAMESKYATKKEAAAILKKELRPGRKILWVQTHRGSGYNRSITFFVIDNRGYPHRLDPYLRALWGLRFDNKHGGVVVDEPGGQVISQADAGLHDGKVRIIPVEI